MTHLPEELTRRLLTFRAEREWEQFHNARSLASALSVEASELLEHFIWARDAEVSEIVDQRREEIEAEMADIAVLLAYLCHDLKVDLSQAVAKKLEANALKYPVEKARGRSDKYTRL
jgi:NTP pyrophosphatase (non-canonical NTP hydrolase)